MSQALQNFVNGAHTPAASGETMDVVDPSTGEVFATAAKSGSVDLDAAYAAAATAFETWGETTPSERQLALLRIADALESRADEFVDAEVRNTGKPRALTASEELPPRSTSCVSSRVRPGCWKAAPPASTWPATPLSSAASRSASSGR